MRALGVRLADADPVDLAEIERVRKELDHALDVAVAGMRRKDSRGRAMFSWAAIGAGLGITKQAAEKRFRS